MCIRDSVNIAQDLGADYVIAVDLLPMNDDQEMERQAEPRNLAEVAMTAIFMLARATQIEQALADVVISPPVAHINLADLTAGEALLDAGYKATAKHIGRIKDDLMR